MSLEQVLEALVTSEPFERLLLERARPILARADAGEDAVVAGLARALDSPVLAVTPGPREADALAVGTAAYLGDDRVALLSPWEALPYEGIGPTPEIAARRADALHELRRARGSFVVVAPALAAMQGLIPTLGTVPRVGISPCIAASAGATTTNGPFAWRRRWSASARRAAISGVGPIPS